MSIIVLRSVQLRYFLRTISFLHSGTQYVAVKAYYYYYDLILNLSQQMSDMSLSSYSHLQAGRGHQVSFAVTHSQGIMIVLSTIIRCF